MGPKATVDQGGGFTIAVADDDPLVLRFITQTLNRAGFETITGRNASEGINAINVHDRSVDLVIANLFMRGGGGLDLAGELATFRPGLPFLFISGVANSVGAESIKRGDAQAILLKPFTAFQLLDRVASLLGRAASNGVVTRPEAARGNVVTRERAEPLLRRLA